jgi:mannose/fructose-specific phosphotransferase system component IIA
MAAAVHAAGPNRMLVAGANLPLLMDILCARDGGADLAALRSSVETNKERYLVLYKEPQK